MSTRRTVLLLSALCLIATLSGCGDSLPDCASDSATEVCQVFQIVNQERQSAGLEPYAWNRELAIAAQLHSEDMVTNSYFSHASQDGRSFSDRAREAGYDASPRGENIARGQRTPERVMQDWMGSSGHRANILSDSSNEIGIGMIDFTWTQVFGRRRPPSP